MKNCYEDTFHSKEWVERYLERIGYHGTPTVSFKTLQELQECHLKSVPYENFDLVNHVPISLELEDLLDKIVVRRRGGFCFEVNRLFGWMLRELGFEVADRFARYIKGETHLLMPMRRHHVLEVEVEGKCYLCDIGVGAVIPLHPMELIEDVEQVQPNGTWKMTKEPIWGWILNEKKSDGSFERIYSFTEEPQFPIDFKAASYYCATSPESVFHTRPMAALRVGNGRNTIDGDVFRVFDGKTLVSSFTPQTKEEYDKALFEHIGIKLD